jgi:hypothetical protein
MAVSFGCPLVLAWLVFMYYRFVDGWLTSLSALGQGLAAMTVLVSVAVVVGGVLLWRRRHRSRQPPAVVIANAPELIVRCPSNINAESPAIERPLSSTGQHPGPSGRSSSPLQSSSSPSSRRSLDMPCNSGVLSDDASEHSNWQFSDDSVSSSDQANRGSFDISLSSCSVHSSRAPGRGGSSFVSLQLQDSASSHDAAASSHNDDTDFGSLSSSGSIQSD